MKIAIVSTVSTDLCLIRTIRGAGNIRIKRARQYQSGPATGEQKNESIGLRWSLASEGRVSVIKIRTVTCHNKNGSSSDLTRDFIFRPIEGGAGIEIE